MNNSKRQNFGRAMCWTLLTLLFLLVITALLYNSFLNKFNIQKLEDYLYTAECCGYNYGFTGKILDANFIKPGCSTVRKGNLVGRNFDWTYDENSDFVITTPAEDGRHQTIGGSFSTQQSAAQLVTDAEKQMYKAKAEFYGRHPEYDRRKRS